MKRHNKYQRQADKLRQKITAAIINRLKDNNLEELELYDTCPDMDPIWVIWFDDYYCDPYECMVKKISICGSGIEIESIRKDDNSIVVSEPPYDIATRSIEWLNEILERVELLTAASEKR